MANSNTERSKQQRAISARNAMQKRLADPNYKQIAISGDRAVIERFDIALKSTGKATRIEQLEALLNQLSQ